MTEDDEGIITRSITTLLARREHSQVEIVRKLQAKGFSVSLIEQQLAKFSAKGIQSDSRFCEALIRSRVSKGQGELRIRAEAREHQLDDAEINAQLRELNVDWFALACQVREKRFGPALPDDWQDSQKQLRFLAYRGFTHEQCQHAVSYHPTD
ncbi:recombination regulator RecX [Aestuariibacter halophilus]|uniref:Regulatory protein RecX n=1 Tax=Fluctibacter halophilus TaxID=226011 RepID=A0ABS8G2T1_9ALTE|nr:regulatory protein RecX [Aestuariibacter halophilus]MCC2614783.1 recombination regulator RecX [Aestuariibacter halophilus]